LTPSSDPAGSQGGRGHPFAPLLYADCLTVSLAEGGAGLGTELGERKAIEMLTETGFTGITVRRPAATDGRRVRRGQAGGLRRRTQPGIEPSWAWAAGLTVRMG
jgi:hypothetical protein